MSSWNYYSQTIDRIYWTDETYDSAERIRTDQRLRDNGLAEQIHSRPAVNVDSIPAGHLTPRSIIVRRRQKGDFGRCPGTHGHLCCNYLTLNVYHGCTLGCTYCIMQHYLRNRTLEIHLPDETTVGTIRRLVQSNPDRMIRLGTGEVGDSLLYDPLFGISGDLIEGLADLGNLRFELKTKTPYVGHLPGLSSASGTGRRNTVIGFSINPQEIIGREEGVAATLEERLDAARRVAAAGYRIAFHFDPMIRIPDWKKAYGDLVRLLADFDSPAPEWISLGTIRYPDGLKGFIERRPYGNDEFIPSGDGKMRYLQPLRSAMYRHMRRYLKEFLPETPVYLCMESAAVWRATAAEGYDRQSLREIMKPVTVGGRV